jgi:uncharacterized protein (DUF1697 family)
MMGVLGNTHACYSRDMVYVALLRGINVGGKSKVDMPRLKVVFESLGCEKVITYINSGNVIFRDDRTATELVPVIEAAFSKEFRIEVPILLRDQGNIRKLCHEIATTWTNDTVWRTDVMFLWDKVDDASIIDKVVHDPSFENLIYLDGALVWNIWRQNVTPGSGVKLIKTDLYKHMTVRNINTVRKLNMLMDDHA